MQDSEHENAANETKGAVGDAGAANDGITDETVKIETVASETTDGEAAESEADESDGAATEDGAADGTEVEAAAAPGDIEDAEACAEALESLDTVEPIAPELGIDTVDGASCEQAPESAGSESASSADETISINDLPHDKSLTRALPGLGSAPVVDGTIAMSDLPLPSAPSAREAEARRRKANPRRRRVLVVAGLVAALAAGGAGYAAWQCYQQEQQAIAKANAHTMMSVTVGAHAAGLDCSTGSKIPLEITGQDADGSAVTLTAFVDEHGRGLKLMPGDYTISVAASPIAADGTVYSVPTKKCQVTVKSDGQDLSGACSFKFKVPSADTVTDEAIAAAAKYAEEGGCNSAGVAKVLERAATARRDAAASAVDARKTQVARDADARHKATSVYALDIPVEWYGKVSTWQNGSTLCIYLANDINTPIVTLVAVKTGETFTPDEGDTVLGSVDLGNGYTVYASGPVYPYLVAQTINGKTDKPVDTYSMDQAIELVELTTGNRYTYSQIKNDLVGSKGNADAATKLETDYLAQILLPSIKVGE